MVKFSARVSPPTWLSQKFVELVRQGVEIAAAKEYQRVTGAGLSECQLATEVVGAAHRGEGVNTHAAARRRSRAGRGPDGLSYE